MKYLATLLLALAVFCPGRALASELPKIGEIIKAPMTTKASGSPLMNVVFTHKTHMGKGFGCATCHHDRSQGSSYVSCTSEDCHSIPGARERDTMSMFMAFHAGDTNRSCYGCHTQLVDRNPAKYAEKFRGCRPCHTGPQPGNATTAAR